MGFTGELVFGRSERPLLEAPVFGGAQEGDGGRITSWPPRPGGWQTLQFHRSLPGDPEAALRAVVEQTGAPPASPPSTTATSHWSWAWSPAATGGTPG
ncbi:hypothetical protein [Streptomyces erythrochromogenes]|uniref:hypothetical protein n=1 Tax=Streptomyces erythrochromogenes TaxID=285574 RepID=UPI0037011811